MIVKYKRIKLLFALTFVYLRYKIYNESIWAGSPVQRGNQ